MDNFYEIVKTIKPLLKKPSKDSLESIQEYFPHKGIRTYFDRELLKSDLVGWYNTFKEIGYFQKENFPIVEADKNLPFWSDLNFLEQISRNFANLEYDAIEEDFLTIVDDFINYLDDLASSDVDIHTHNDWILFTIIQNFDLKYLKLKHIEFMNQAIHRHKQHSLVVSEIRKTFLVKVLQCSQAMIDEFYKVLFSYEISEREYSDKFVSLVEEYWLKDLIERSLKLLTPEQAYSIGIYLLHQLEEMTKIDYWTFSTIKIPSIEESEQRRDYDRSISTVLVDFIRDLFEMQEPSKIKIDVRLMLDNDEEIIKRLAIHLINHRFVELRDIFFNYPDNLLDTHNLNHELYVLFNTYRDELTKEEAIKVIELIECQDFSYLEEDEDNEKYGELRKAYRKRKYLYALRGSVQHEEFSKLFEKYNQDIESDDEHPEFDSYSSGVRMLNRISPIGLEEIKTKTAKELSEYIRVEFKEDKSLFDGPTHKGLAEELHEIITTDPDLYINDLKDFITLDEEYFYKIIDAYKLAIQKGEFTKVKTVLDFILNFLDEIKGKEKLNHWHISSPISDLISELSSSDKNHIIDENMHKSIILTLLSADKIIQNYEDEDEVQDYISHLLNAPKGHIYSAMIKYSLKYARDHKAETDRWIIEIKELFTSKVESDRSIDLYTAVGMYLPNISYLDNDWLEKYFDVIFGKDTIDHLWEASFSGYLYNSTLYLKLYNDMKNIGALNRAMEFKFSQKDVIKRLVEYVCISFNSENESLASWDSMISTLIAIGTIEQLEVAIKFFQDRRGKKEIDIENVLKPFWHQVYNIACEKGYTSLHYELIELIRTITELDDEITDLLLHSIDKLEKFDRFAYLIFDNFLRLLDGHSQNVAKIFVALLQKFSIGTHEMDKIIKIVEYFYKHGLKEEADLICNLYGEYGEYKLEDTYMKFNEK